MKNFKFTTNGTYHNIISILQEAFALVHTFGQQLVDSPSGKYLNLSPAPSGDK